MPCPGGEAAGDRGPPRGLHPLQLDKLELTPGRTGFTGRLHLPGPQAACPIRTALDLGTSGMAHYQGRAWEVPINRSMSAFAAWIEEASGLQSVDWSGMRGRRPARARTRSTIAGAITPSA